MAENVIIISGLGKDLTDISRVNIDLKTENEEISATLKLRLSTKTRLVKQIQQKKYFKKLVKHLKKVIMTKNQQLKQLQASKSFGIKTRNTVEEKLKQKEKK